MCGIVGYISQNENLYKGPKDHFMRYALALDTLRGDDSTGLVTLSKKFTVKTMKSMLPGDAYVHSADYLKNFKVGWAQIGHNRAATAGKVTIENAHPFTFGDVTLVHNGTLYQDGKSLPTYDHSLPVDSMQIALALSKFPPEKATEVLSQIDGAFALVWSDRRDGSINMARNSERPLHFTFNSNKSVMWYMSDGHHLHSINKSFRHHECKGQNIYEMDRLRLLKFKKGDMRPEVTKFDPFVRPVVKKTTKSTHTAGKGTSSGGQSSALKRASERWEQSTAKNGGTTTPLKSGSTVKVDLQGRKRKVPLPMQQALASELCLSPNDLLKFEPDVAEKMPDGKFTVYGTMFHKEWGDTPWEMTLYNVPVVQYNAYRRHMWLVRPIGICHPHKFDQKNPAVLGHLVHCDWKGYYEKYLRDNESSDDDKEGDSAASILVPGPGGQFITQHELAQYLAGSCINCGGAMKNEELEECVIVNDGQDIICEECVDELTAATLKGHPPTIN